MAFRVYTRLPGTSARYDYDDGYRIALRCGSRSPHPLRIGPLRLTRKFLPDWRLAVGDAPLSMSCYYARRLPEEPRDFIRLTELFDAWRCGMSAKVLDMAGSVLLVAVPVLYVLRTQDQRPLRGRWLLVIVGAVAIVPAAAWYRALHRDLAWPAEALALATTVPMVQLGVLVLSLSVF